MTGYNRRVRASGPPAVRPATSADVAAVQALAVAAYRDYLPRIGRAPAPMNADYAAAIRCGQVWVAVTGDEQIVGLLVLVPRSDHLLLENVAVLPSAQHGGIGARLLALAEERARAAGLDEMRLYTNEAMSENLAYYRTHGYAETSRGEQDGYRRVYFSKRLAD